MTHDERVQEVRELVRVQLASPVAFKMLLSRERLVLALVFDRRDWAADEGARSIDEVSTRLGSAWTAAGLAVKGERSTSGSAGGR